MESGRHSRPPHLLVGLSAEQSPPSRNRRGAEAGRSVEASSLTFHVKHHRTLQFHLLWYDHPHERSDSRLRRCQVHRGGHISHTSLSPREEPRKAIKSLNQQTRAETRRGGLNKWQPIASSAPQTRWASSINNHLHNRDTVRRENPFHVKRGVTRGETLEAARSEILKADLPLNQTSVSA